MVNGPRLKRDAGADLAQVRVVEQAVLFQLVFHQRQRELGAEDRHPQFGKHPGQRADVVFMPVGQNDAADFVAVLDQICDVGNNDIHAEQFGFREHKAGVDDDNVIAVAHGHAVHSEFAEAAKGYKMEFLRGHGQQMMLTERMPADGRAPWLMPRLRTAPCISAPPPASPACPGSSRQNQPHTPLRQYSSPAIPAIPFGDQQRHHGHYHRDPGESA